MPTSNSGKGNSGDTSNSGKGNQSNVSNSGKSAEGETAEPEEEQGQPSEDDENGR